MSDAVAVALIMSLGSLTVAGVTAYYQYRGNIKIVELQDTVKDQQGDIDKLKQERDRNRSVINGWRRFWAQFVVWLKQQNLAGYPEPEDKLLDTGEHKAVGGEK